MRRAWKTSFRFSRMTAAVILLTVVGLGLRVWGINFGLPYVYHVDEQSYVARALWIGQGQLIHEPYTPTGLSNLIFLEYALYFVIGKLAGGFPSASAFEAAYRTDPSVFYLLARLTNAVLGALTIPVTFILAQAMARLRKMDEQLSSTLGMAAAVLMTVCFLHVRDAHFSTPDVATTFFIILATTIFTMNVSSPRPWKSFLGGLSAGAAFAFKWTAAPVFFVAAVYLIALWSNQKDRRALPVRQAVLTFAGILLGIVMISPQFVIGPAPYFREFFVQFISGSSGGYDFWQIDTLPGWLFYAKSIVIGFGAAAALLSAVGLALSIVRTVRRRDLHHLLLITFPVIYFLLMGSTRHYFVRYAILLLPFLSIFAADAIVTIAVWVSRRVSINRIVTAAALVGITASIPIANTVLFNTILTRKDTRTEAKEWIEANLPDRAKVAVDWQVHGPPLSTADEPMPYSKRIYSVTIVGNTGLAEHPVEWYRQNGYDYLITSSFITDLTLVHPRLDKERDAFYQSLDEQFELIKTIDATASGVKLPFAFDEIYGPYVSTFEREFPGPLIKIYKVK